MAPIQEGNVLIRIMNNITNSITTNFEDVTFPGWVMGIKFSLKKSVDIMNKPSVNVCHDVNAHSLMGGIN